MARIKYVLNERRLGIMAVAEPDVEAQLAAEMAAELAEEGEMEMEDDAIVSDSEVAKEEVEARDEGFGGGREAKEFVDDIKVEQGHVQKKD
jgi:large subunit ribosomal protein L47